MTRRRGVLFGGLVALVASAGRTAVGAPVDIEGAGYGGTASGGWACGPDARVKYGGGGAEVHVREGERGQPDHGWNASFGGAIEGRSFTALDCGGACNDAGAPIVVPSGGAVGAGVARIGWDGRWFGARGGVNVFEVWNKHDDRGPTVLVIPALTLRLGLLDGLRFEGGLGSYDVPTMTRPGLWAGLGYVFAPGWEATIHGGVHQTFDGGGGARGALALACPLADDVQLTAGFALSEGSGSRVEPEGQAGLRVRVW
jgi:hypothetical protein